jgi:hypothetical protein
MISHRLPQDSPDRTQPAKHQSTPPIVIPKVIVGRAAVPAIDARASALTLTDE